VMPLSDKNVWPMGDYLVCPTFQDVSGARRDDIQRGVPDA
jgi:hypothetical protein